MTLLLYFIAFVSFLLVILNLLPVGSLSPEFYASFQTIVSDMKAWDFVLPIHEMFVLVVIVAAVEVSIYVFKFTRWAIHLVRGATN